MTTTSTNFGAMLEGLLAAKAGHEAEKAELEQNLRATEEKLRLVRDAITSVAPLAGVDPAPLLASTATDAARASASQVESAPSRDLGSEPPTQRRADYDIPTLVIEVACRGKSIADAAIAILALVNRPLTEGVIASFLVEGGVVFTAADRHTAVHYA